MSEIGDSNIAVEVGDVTPISVELDVTQGAGSGLIVTPYTGSDLSGAVGTGRTLSGVSGTVKLVFVERGFLHPTVDFSVSGGVITFNTYVGDSDQITVYTQ